MDKNKLSGISEILYKQLKRLDDESIMKNFGEEEIARSNAMSNVSKSIIQSTQTGLRIIDTANRTGDKVEKIVESLGLKNG